jgi:hypothetical protein
MTAYQNCKVSEVMPVTLPSGVAGAGYASASAARTSDLSSRCRLRRGKTAEQARAGVAEAVEKSVEITPQA